jgi:hypothetical protein
MGVRSRFKSFISNFSSINLSRHQKLAIRDIRNSLFMTFLGITCFYGTYKTMFVAGGIGIFLGLLLFTLGIPLTIVGISHLIQGIRQFIKL